jgi:hypothetical protein
VSRHHPPATRDHHETFCTTEKWNPVLNARGKSVGHHVTYELPLRDGRILRTRISRPVDRTTYGPSIWGAILRDQLDVSADEFWACVTAGTVPRRGAIELPQGSLPLQLVMQLTKTVGHSEAAVARMTKSEAVQALNDYWLTTSDIG